MEETIFELNGKQYKALMEFAAKEKHSRPALERPFIKDGNLYATDSYKAVRVSLKDAKVESGVFSLDVDASRLKVGDKVAIFNDATMAGGMRFEHNRDFVANVERMAIDQLFNVEELEVKSGHGYDPDYMASLAKLAKAFNGALEFRFSDNGMIHAEVVNAVSPLKVEAIVMPIRFAKKEN